MRIQSVLDGLLVLLEQAVQESKVNGLASNKLKVLYDTCATKIYPQIYGLRNREKVLGWDETLVAISQILSPVVQYRTDKDNRSPGDLSIALDSLVVVFSGLPKKLNEYFEELSEFSQKVKPLEETPRITWDAIVGSEREKGLLIEGCMYPEIYSGLYPVRATGVLLFGVPGTGKTLMIKAMAHRFKGIACIFTPTEGDLRGQYEGETQQKIHALYDNVRNYLDRKRPLMKMAFVVFDEGEGLLGTGRGSGDASKGRSVGPILQEMEGVKSDIRIVTVVITNHPDVIDSAALSRLPLQIRFDLPGIESMAQLVLTLIVGRYLNWIYSFVMMDQPEKQIWPLMDLYGHPKEHLVMKDITTMAEVLTKNGYSQRDVTKGMNLAFNQASTRALGGLSTAKFLSGGKGGYKLKQFTSLFTLSIDKGGVTRTITYSETITGRNIPLPKLSDIKVIVLPNGYLPLMDQTILDVAPLPPSSNSDLVTFDFRLSDFRAVFDPKVFRPSVTAEMKRAITDFESGVE